MKKNFYLEGRAHRRAGRFEDAYESYQNAICIGDYKGYYGLALLAEASGKPEAELSQMYRNCFDDIKRLALNGDSCAASIVGVYYAMGLGTVEQNAEQAHLWFMLGANGGDEVAQFNLAVHYYLGVVVDQDYACAMKWVEAALIREYKPAFSLKKEIENAIAQGYGEKNDFS